LLLDLGFVFHVVVLRCTVFGAQTPGVIAR
jgi:hypothetical protein